jgi:hypothetical protein
MWELKIVRKRLIFKENYIKLAFKLSNYYTLLNRSKTQYSVVPAALNALFEKCCFRHDVHMKTLNHCDIHEFKVLREAPILPMKYVLK